MVAWTKGVEVGVVREDEILGIVQRIRSEREVKEEA